MLIIDGPDNVGKTTLAKKIVDVANKKSNGPRFTSRHLTRPPEDWDYFKGYKKLAESGMYTVQDRFHLGTIAYDEVTRYNKYQLRIIESWIYSSGSLVVLLLPQSYRNYEVRLRSKENSKDEMFDVDRILRAATIYEEISNGDFVGQHEFGINPIVDYSYDVNFNEKGEFCRRLNNRWWEEIIEMLVDEWFKRIEWSLKGNS